MKMPWYKKIVFSAVGGALLFLGFVLYANLKIVRYDSEIDFISDVPTTTIGLVFGAGVKKDGTPTPMLYDRIYTGVALYRAGKVEKLMMTGDDGRMWSDEVSAMKRVAMELGVPEEKIMVDRHGYRTYESCFREAKVYGLTDVIAVSQNFHLSRIIYLCRSFGINTKAVGADFQNYGPDLYWMQIREVGARLKAWWQVAVSHPDPQEPTLKD